MKHFVVISLFFLVFSNSCISQTLNGVYVRNFIVQNGDTLEATVKGKVISKETSQPIVNATVEYYSTAGEKLTTLTDFNGCYKFSGMQTGNIRAKIMCLHSYHFTETADIDTLGNNLPQIHEVDFTLKSNVIRH